MSDRPPILDYVQRGAGQGNTAIDNFLAVVFGGILVGAVCGPLAIVIGIIWLALR